MSEEMTSDPEESEQDGYVCFSGCFSSCTGYITHLLLSAPAGKEKYALLVKKGQNLAPLPEEDKVMENRVMGCTAQVREGT